MAASSAEVPAEAPSEGPPAGRLSAPRRLLLSTVVSEVRAHPEAERPELVDDLRRMDRLFLGELGYTRGAELGVNPTRQRLTRALRAFATAPERRPDDYVVLYVAAHGVTADHSGRHYLLLHDSDARDLRGTALPTEDLVAQIWEDTTVERLLVLIDACYAEEGADNALRGALEARRFREPVTEHGHTGLVLVSSSRRKEETYTGALSAAFDRAVRRRATVGHVPAHIGLQQIMAAIRSDPEVPRAQRPVWSLTHATGDIPAFLPNPRHLPEAAGLKLEEIDHIVALGAREREAREQDMRGFFLPRARGTDAATEDVWHFTGRHTAIADLTSWLAPRRAGERLCVVTGDPGSGKSSLLGLMAVLTDQQRTAAVPRTGLPPDLPGPGDIDLRVNAGHLSTRQLLDALAAAIGCAAESLGAFTVQLQTRTRPLVVLIDSLDEALAPHETVDELIVPLTDPERQLPLRLLVGARPHIAARLPATAPRVDLDSERYADPDAVRAYAGKLLRAPGSVLATTPTRLVDATAEAIADAAGRSFLVARITARTVAHAPRAPAPDDRRWREELPRLPGEAMERDLVQRLGPHADKARDLLRPLAYAQGAGLPWAGVWARLASALADGDHGYDDDDIVWLRQAAGSYVVESEESGGSVYRIYHRALIEYLREGRDAGHVQRAVTDVLKGVEDPYVRRYLALHAAEGGVLDPLAQDARFVLRSDPVQLLSALPHLRSTEGRRAGEALRDVETMLRNRVRDGGKDQDRGISEPEARARLRLAAVCRGAGALADSCDAGDEELPWRARWAAWNPHEGARRYPGMRRGTDTGVVVPADTGAAYLELDRREGGYWWSLADGDWYHFAGEPGTVHPTTLTAPAQLPRTVAAVAYGDRVELRDRRVVEYRYALLLRVWDLRHDASTTWLLQPSDVTTSDRIPAAPAQLVVLGQGEGRPENAVLRFSDGHVAVYRLGSASHYPPLTRRELRNMYSHDIETWQKHQSQRSARRTRVLGPRGGRRITTCAAPRGAAPSTLLTGWSDGLAAEVNLDTGRDGAEVRTGHDGPVTHLDLITGHPQGRLLVTAGHDSTVRVSSLVSGEPVRTLLSGGARAASLAVRRVAGQWIVAVATEDGRLHRIDLDSGRPIGLPLRVDRGSTVRVAVFGLGSVHCVSVQGDRLGLQLYDLVTGDRVGGQVLRHEAGAVTTVGGTLCVGGSDGIVRFWPTARAADSTQVTAHQGPVLALGQVRGPSGAPALVSVGQDHEIRCWDPARPQELWHRRILDPGPWESPLIGCAAVGRTRDGRDVVVTGEYGGRVRVLVLRDGLPVAEQEFTVPDIVTTLLTGRVRERDVIVVGTGSGRIACWDVTAGRMYALGPAPAPAPDSDVWTTAMALEADGSGRLATGTTDGTVREWSLPTCRPLGPVRRPHRGQVRALVYAAGRLVGSGGDHYLTAYDDGPGQRRPVPVTAFCPTEERDVLLAGDERGEVWRIRMDGIGLDVTQALDVPRPVSVVTTVRLGEATTVVAGAQDGSLQVREMGGGKLLRRLRPVCDSGVRELLGVSWRSPGREPRPLLFTRSERGVLEYWDFDGPGGVRTEGRPLVTPVPHQGERASLAVLPTGDGAQSLLSLVPWDARQSPYLGESVENTHVAVHDVARGPLHDQPCAAWQEEPDLQALRALRCAGRLLVFVEVAGSVVRVLDTVTRRWAQLPEDDLVDVFALTRAGRDDILVVGAERTRVFAWETLRHRFEPGERPAPVRPRSRRPLRGRSERPVPPVHEHGVVPPVVRARHAVLLSDGETYAVAGGTDLVMAGARDGVVRFSLELPSPCTALAAGPGGELVVGTRNGPLLFDRE
ncbi:caspase family protein [Streptomyces sp. NPDC057433]|uniref:caspase family protein n=1 Tax=Streptomyces sp. NPDC057433 TaxID=3346132 RepID=UPI0036939490